jgi:hypothetical protein
MGTPQVPEQVRRAPILALRAVFAGIGRILLSADRVGADNAGAERAGAKPAATPALDQPQQAAEPGSQRRSLDQTGNVRLLPATEMVEAADAPAPADPAIDVPGIGDRRIAEQTVSMPALPLANYDSLSLASIRARLRGLDVGQLKVLLDYEAANAERPEVLGMFERRIEKLESGG